MVLGHRQGRSIPEAVKALRVRRAREQIYALNERPVATLDRFPEHNANGALAPRSAIATLQPGAAQRASQQTGSRQGLLIKSPSTL